MTLPPGRFDYAPLNDRPIIKWPNNARVAFWVAPNMEFFEYLPESRPTQPDIPFYARMDYGNRVGFWRMLDVLNKHKVRACCCLNLELLDHFPEVKDAMIAADWDYMAHGLYNSRPIYDYTEEQERAYWQDFTTHLKEMTGKRLKGRLGGGAGYTVRTDDLMAEAGCLYHTSWIIDDQPWPINVRGGQKFIYVPYTGQTNDGGMLANAVRPASLEQHAGAHRGNCGVFDTGRRNLARHGLSAEGNRIRTFGPAAIMPRVKLPKRPAVIPSSRRIVCSNPCATRERM